MKKRLIIFISILGILLFSIAGCKLFQCEPTDEVEYFPVLGINAADNYDLGYKIGQGFSNQINIAIERQADLIATVQYIISFDSTYFYHNLVDAAEAAFPEYINELQGIADGAEVPFEILMTLNLFGDVIALYYGLPGVESIEVPESTLGCSTVSYSYDGTQYLAHNEDGMAELHDLMGVVRAKLPGKPEMINLYYPGLIPGVGPSMTEAGLAFSGNYIQSLQGNPAGVPHLFIFRSLLDALSVDESISMIEDVLTCNYLHINIASRIENRIVSVEKAENTTTIYEVDELYTHTNHFIQDEMLGFAIDYDATTLDRYTTLTNMINIYENDPGCVTCDILHGFLCEVAAEPDTTGGITGGMTLGSSIINLETGKWKLLFNNPIDNLSQILFF